MSEILILSAGRRVSLVRAFQLAAAGHGIDVVTADMNPKMSSACHISDKCLELPHVQDERYADALLAYCKANSVALIVPTIDTELLILSQLRPQLMEIGVSPIVSDASLVGICRDKRETAQYFSTLGLDSPKLMDKNALSFPVFVKPFDGSLSVGAMLLRESSDMTEDILQNGRNMFCEYLDSKQYDEYTCDAYFDKNGRIRTVVPRLRIEVRGGEVAKGRTEHNDIVPYLMERLEVLPGARGCLTIQIMRNRDSGRKYLIEVNPRFGGGYPLTSRAGATYHSWLIDEYILGKEISVWNGWQNKLLMLRFDDEIFVDPEFS